MATRSSRPTGGAWRILGFFVLVAAVLGLTALLLNRADEPADEPYAVASPASMGLLGLRLWLEDLGYEVELLTEGPPAAEARVVILFPDADVDATDRTNLRKWVEQGNTLVVANASQMGLPSTFGVMVQTRQTFSDATLQVTQPLLPASVRQHRPVSGRTLSTMTPTWHTVPVLVTDDGDAAVLLQMLGEGFVWHIGLNRVFTNGDLRSGWGPELAIAALRGVPVGSMVQIFNGEQPDARGLAPGRAPGGPDGLWESMLRHPLGWAALSLAALLLVYLFTQGRRLGPPTPAGAPSSRRAAVEHILAMASLAQRAGHRDAIATYQKARLKRRLGQSWRVSAELDDAAFVAGLAEQGSMAPDKVRELTDLLARLGARQDEATLVRTVAEANRFSLE
jgi:hypothetical protein